MGVTKGDTKQEFRLELIGSYSLGNFATSPDLTPNGGLYRRCIEDSLQIGNPGSVLFIYCKIASVPRIYSSGRLV